MSRADTGASPTRADDVAALLDFVAERDAPCPLCGYNLRGLTTPTCPECRQPLRLQVGMVRPRLGGLIASAAPGMFSGMATIAIVVVMVVAFIRMGPPGGPVPPGIILLLGFGVASGLIALALLAWRWRFLRLPLLAQWMVAAALWLVHLSVFAILLALSL